MAVRDFLAIAETALGGSTGYAIADISAIAVQLTVGFWNFTPSP